MSAQFHMAIKPLPSQHNSQAIWSLKPDGRVVVFVHGLGGSSVGTWTEFQNLLIEEPACAGCDFVFFGYDSLYQQANASAFALEDFLDRLLIDPHSVINPTVLPSYRREPAFEFRSVLLVAHSLGAIVSRRAILNARTRKKKWVGKTGLFLFAPAHLGSRSVQQLAAEAIAGLPWIGHALRALLGYKLAPLDDLAQGSPTLKQLEKDTLTALRSKTAPYLVAKQVVFGMDERLVETGQFCKDPPAVFINGHDHNSVCKPSATFMVPVVQLVPYL